MYSDPRKVAELKFEIKNGKVITYIDGQLTKDTVPKRASTIFQELKKKESFRYNENIISDKSIIEILMIDDQLIEKEIEGEEGYDPDEDLNIPGLFTDYIKFAQMYLENESNKTKKIDLQTIKDILYQYELHVVLKEQNSMNKLSEGIA